MIAEPHDTLAALPPAGRLLLALAPDLAAQVRAAARSRGASPRQLVIDVVAAVFAPGAASLVGAVLDDGGEA